MSKDLIEREKLLSKLRQWPTPEGSDFVTEEDILSAPAVDAVPVDDIKSWLYEIAMNNVGVVLDGDFSDACEEIIARLDGLRRYSAERRADNE